MAEHSTQRPHRIVISGAGGLVGGALKRRLQAEGRKVQALTRPESDRPGIAWDIEAGTIEADRLEGIDAVVHLAGESISGIWTDEKRRRIRLSRVRGTTLLAETLAGLDDPPDLICASAVGFYGDRGEETLNEDSAPGHGFLADVCKAWEAAADPARRAGIRTAHLRFGIVLSAKGGALQQMLPPFKLGLGGRLGSGRQWMSWIHLDDVVEAVRRAIDDPKIEGPVNVVAPSPARNQEFTDALGRALNRPTILPVPALALKTALGDMGRELLLASTRVVPGKLESHDFAFRFPNLDAAFEDLVG